MAVDQDTFLLIVADLNSLSSKLTREGFLRKNIVAVSFFSKP